MKQSEKEILQGIKKNDQHAFEILFRSYYTGLCRYAGTILNDTQLADDAVQTVFINLWEKRQTVKIKIALKPYLFRSTYNTCINLIKQKELSEKGRKALSVLSSDIDQSFILRIEADELERIIAGAIESLPNRCRLILEHSRIKGLKNQDIAYELNISIKTVEAQLSKALQILRKTITYYSQR